jgi:hypothetical protein
LTGCGQDFETAINAWNTRSAQVVSDYETLKELATPYEEQFINMYLYNYASDDIAQFFPESINNVGEDGEGSPNLSYFDRVRAYVYKDSYDDILRDRAVKAGMFLQDYCETLATTGIDDYDYNFDSIGLHEFFISAYMSTITEIYAIECTNGSELRVIVTWEDNKIIDVERYI